MDINWSNVNDLENYLQRMLNNAKTVDPSETYYANGSVVSKDPELNKVLKEVQEESGPLGAVIPAVSFIEDPDDKDKAYIGLMHSYEGNDYWFIRVGRQKMYDTLKNLVKEEEIDPNNSFVISGIILNDNVTLKSNMEIDKIRPITVFRFIKVMKDTNKVIDTDTDFDITEYDPDSENGDNTILDSN